MQSKVIVWLPNEEDLIVFILSGVNRLCITGDHDKDAELYDNIDKDLEKILEDELIYGNWKYESFLYALSRKGISRRISVGSKATRSPYLER